MVFGNLEHLLFKRPRAHGGMGLEVRFPVAFRVQHGSDPAIGRFPDEGRLLDRIAGAAILDNVPPPVVEPRDVPAQLSQAVIQHCLAEKSLDAPVVLFVRDTGVGSVALSTSDEST